VDNQLPNNFSYCDFANATNALAFVGSGDINQVIYCTFTNIINAALAFNNTVIRSWRMLSVVKGAKGRTCA
jgi:hypothetical protein